MKISVVDYDIGNLLSVERALSYCGAQVIMAKTAGDIKKAERLIVPGVGAFRGCMQSIEQKGLVDSLIEFAMSGRPYMGICVGMQMLLDVSSEHGHHNGLGLIGGEVTKMKVAGQRIPFIGWKEIKINNKIGKYYFVHSYHANPRDKNHIYSTYRFGEQDIVAAVRKDNIIGVQFHPEKSADSGIKLLKDFLAI